jgi:hypothetical protein
LADVASTGRNLFLVQRKVYRNMYPQSSGSQHPKKGFHPIVHLIVQASYPLESWKKEDRQKGKGALLFLKKLSGPFHTAVQHFTRLSHR